MLSAELHQAFLTFFAVVSVVSNGLLIFLVLHQQNRSLGGYRYLLVVFACVDVIISGYHACAVPVLYQFEYGSIVFTKAGLARPGPLGFSINSACVVLFYQPFALLACHFVYRYLVAIRPTIIHEHGLPLAIMTVVVNILFGYASVHVCLMLRDLQRDGDDAHANAELLDAFGIDMHARPRPNVFAASYYLVDGGANWRGLGAIGVEMATTTAALAVSVACAARIARCLRTRVMALGARRLQLQLLRALVVQFLVPFALCIAPIAFFVLLPFTGFRSGDTSSVLGMVVALFPAVDPIMVIAMIARFRLLLVQYYVKLMGNVLGVSRLMVALSTASRVRFG